MHDLREKVVIAGIDIAREAAKAYKLPPIEKADEVENYSVSNLIDLAYRIGLLSRPEWRRLSRCYEIRRDLEHEDDEYEAGIEDCIYIFKTCIEVVLAKDPAHLIRVQDIKELVEQPTPMIPAESFIDDYAQAPQPRQEEIMKFLLSIATNKEQSEIVQQNAYNALVRFEPLTQNPVKLTLASHLQGKIGRSGLDRRTARVAFGAGALPYLKRADIATFFDSEFQRMQAVGHRWDLYAEHGELLRSFQELGGLRFCPADARHKILKFLVQLYLGEPGGRTSYGNIRHVFYSNTGAPIVETLISNAKDTISDELRALRNDKDIERLCSNSHIARRFEALVDLVESTP